jgi:hypothetical protein
LDQAMSRELHRASFPNVLRAIGLMLLIAGLFFKIQHWPWQELVLITAWAVILAGIVWRIALRRPIPRAVMARDLFTFGMVSLVVLRMLHLPGVWVALAVALVGGLAVLWFDRSRFWPTAGDRGSQPWLFYPALAMVLVGVLFRIQHWPYSTELLVGGLVMVAVWFLWSMRSERDA